MDKNDIIVVGGGAIGAFSCYSLLKNNFNVTWITGIDPKESAAWGSAGIIAIGVGVPLPSYESLGAAAKWVLEKDPPIKLSPRFLISRLGWFLSYVKRSEVPLEPNSTALLKKMAIETRDQLDDLINSKLLNLDFSTRGILMTYSTEKDLNRHVNDLSAIKNNSLSYKILNNSTIKDVEPTLSDNIVGGILFEDDNWINSSDFIEQMRGIISGLGGTVIDDKLSDAAINNGHVDSVQTASEKFKADNYVFSMGSYSREFFSKFGIKLPIAPGWGHRVTLEPTKVKLQLPLMLGDYRVSASQLSNGSIRLSGFFELSSPDYVPADSKYTWLQDKASLSLPFLKDLKIKDTWSGMRPCTPDGLPIIGKLSGIDNLILAVGHCREGLTLSASTGTMITSILKSGMNEIDPLLRPERFGL